MPEYIRDVGRHAGKVRFRFETDEEREVLDQAYDYYMSAKIFFIDCLGYNITSKGSSGRFNSIRKGVLKRGNRTFPCTISLKDWEKIQECAKLTQKGIRYDHSQRS